VSILPLQNLNISHNRQLVFFVNQRVRSSAEHNVGNQSSLFVGSRVLSDRNSHCEVTVRQVRAHRFVSQHHVKSYNSVLGVLGALQQHVHVDVLN